MYIKYIYQNMDERILWYIRNRIENIPVENFCLRSRDQLDYSYVQKNLSVENFINSDVSKHEAYQKLINADTPGAWTIYQISDGFYNLIYEDLNGRVREVSFYKMENGWINPKINPQKTYTYFLDMLEDILEKKSLYYVNYIY